MSTLSTILGHHSFECTDVSANVWYIPWKKTWTHLNFILFSLMDEKESGAEVRLNLFHLNESKKLSGVGFEPTHPYEYQNLSLAP